MIAINSTKLSVLGCQLCEFESRLTGMDCHWENYARCFLKRCARGTKGGNYGAEFVQELQLFV